MTTRTRVRRSLPWVIAAIGGFLAAYLIVAFIIFPSGIILRDVRVPNVTGLAFDDAARRLAERGLRGIKGEERNHAASPKGTVLEQMPRANSRDVEGATVTLVVSAGQRMSRVPPIVGMSRENAERALTDAGLELGDITERASDSPRGAVVEVQPAAGTSVPTPSAVTIVLSLGDDVVMVPDVVGRLAADARAILEHSRLSVSEVEASGATAERAGRVVAQSPVAGSQVSAGARVVITVGGPVGSSSGAGNR